ncbi:SPX domain-containing protein [Xylariales sp. AK1849]|nr:SPX domain-containing protein [Xylariales sp. AK1849]
MKFAQEFRRSLQREGFPRRWVDSAIPYGQLKKCLKKVTHELEELGLDKDTLTQLGASQSSDSSPGGYHGFHYDLDGEPSSTKHLRPRLTVFVHLRDGVAVDATLSPATREFLGNIASKKASRSQPSTEAETHPDMTSSSAATTHGSGHSPAAESSENSSVQQVEVPLVFDGEFFDILQTDVSKLDTLQEEEQRKLKGDITILGQEITQFTKPSNGKKAQDDLARWRVIFELYLDARVFFSTRESDHGARSSTQALKQLQWFQEGVLKRKLVQGLKLSASREAFNRFLNVNALLLQNLKFQEINQTAIAKILKKFDKRTSLGVAKTFPVAVHSDRLLAGSVAKDLCAQVSTEIISVIPQLDDYLCPICFAVAYWPIRLACDHIFCSRCCVKMQRKGERLCPLCRGDVIMRAGADNYDKTLAAFLRDYFPKEVKEKVQANELERGKEIFGPDYTNRPCSIM